MPGFELSRDGRPRGVGLMLIGAALLLLGGCRSFVSERQQNQEATTENGTAGAIDFSDLSTRAPAVSTAAADRAATAAAVSGAEVGRPAPDFTLPTLDGEEVSLSDYLGRPVLINFWASWCPPCRLEMPHLVEAYEANQDAGFIILAVDLTFQDSLSDVEAFVEEFEMTFPVLLDMDGAVTNKRYRLLGLPMSVFVNREGIVAHVQIGAMTGEQIDAFVAEIVTAPPTSTPAPVVQGQEVYLRVCAECHGQNGEGYANELAAPALDESEHAWHHPDQQLRDWIVNGKLGLGREMPAYGDQLSDEEVAALITYLHTLWTPEQLETQQDVTSRYQEP